MVQVGGYFRYTLHLSGIYEPQVQHTRAGVQEEGVREMLLGVPVRAVSDIHPDPTDPDFLITEPGRGDQQCDLGYDGDKGELSG